MIFKGISSSWFAMQFLEKTENLRKYGHNKLLTIEARRSYLVPQPNNHTIKLFSENVLATEMKKKVISKPVYWGLSVLEISKIVIYEFPHDYVKAKYAEKAGLCYTSMIPTALQSTKHQKTRHFHIYFKRCWNKIWYSNHEL